MICLDSDMVIDFFKGKERAISLMRKIKGNPLAITAITVFEVLYGFYLKNETGKASEAVSFFSSLQLLTMDLEAAHKAAKIAGHLGREGRTINEFDILIAGAMLANGCTTIATFNKKDFEKIRELQVSDAS